MSDFTNAATTVPITMGTKRSGRLISVITSPIRAASWLGGSFERHWQNVLAAFVQVWANKARSFLTTLGIIIAVMSTITVVSFVQAFGNQMTDILRGFGTNMMFVLPHIPGGMHGRMFGRVLMDVDDARAVGVQCDKVRRVSPMLFSSATIEYGHVKLEDVEMQAGSEQFQTIRKFSADEGRFFGPIDVDSGSYVCVIGRTVLEKLEADESIIGDYVYINQQRFQVLGILEEKGAAFDEDQDDVILIPYTTGVKMFPFMSRFMPFVVEVTAEEDVEEATLQISSVLRTRHGLEPGDANDFRILSQDQILRSFEQVKMIATSVLAGIVGISLIVGGVGIMNVMLVSVTERTREIGLRKSIGGRRRDILAQFLTEAVVLSSLGGTLGIAAAYAICSVASLHPSMVEVPVPIWVVALAIGFSAGVGVVFGMIPAFKAAILHPIDALRHE